jgi:hypothetical protein
MKRRIILLTLLVLLLMASAILAQASGYDMQRFVFGAGGGHVASGNYILDGTVGQAVAGDVSIGNYRLHSGFWFDIGPIRIYLPLIMR